MSRVANFYSVFDPRMGSNSVPQDFLSLKTLGINTNRHSDDTPQKQQDKLFPLTLTLPRSNTQ